MPSRHRIMAVQAEGEEFPDYIVKDTVTGARLGPWFETPEDAELWLDLDIPGWWH